MTARGARPLIAAAVSVVAAAVLSGCVAPEGDRADAATASAQRWSPESGDVDGGRRAVAAAVLPVALARVQRSDPDATARAAVEVWFSWNPNTDRGPNDAAARSGPLLSASLQARVTGTGVAAGPGARWLEWTTRRAVAAVRVDASQEAVPPQTLVYALRAYLLTQTWYAPDGTVVDRVGFAVTVALVRAGTRWEVDDVVRG